MRKHIQINILPSIELGTFYNFEKINRHLLMELRGELSNQLEWSIYLAVRNPLYAELGPPTTKPSWLKK